MLDLNDVPNLPLPAVHYDLDAIVACLRDRAGDWVPDLFPNGRRVGDEWRLANIRGDAPRKNGSCVIALKGDRAGDWHEFDGGEGGGPLSTIEQATGLTGRELFAYAAELASWSPAAPPVKHEAPRQSNSPKDHAREIALMLAHAVPLAGTTGERYLRARGVALQATSDLLFHPDLVHWDTRRGFPGLVAIIRDRGGEQVAIHRTYLSEDGGKAAVDKPRMMLGPVAGGAVRLGPLGENGVLGLAEGIETALAVMTACPLLPVWATLSASNLEQVQLPPEVRRVVLLADHDASGAGQSAAQAAALRLVSEGRRVWIALPPREGDDFNDLLVREGAETVKSILEAATEVKINASSGPSLPWTQGLLRNREGKVLPVLANALHALRHAREWDGVLWHDEFATRTVARKPLPWVPRTSVWIDHNWSDGDDYLATEWLQRHGVMVPASIAGQAVEAVARDRVFHPVREYLDGLSWDGMPRIEDWLVRYLGAADTPYTRAIGPRWLISAVARVHRPGCKADCVLILEGPQGIRKSSALKVLAEPWFADRLSDLGSKDAAMETRGVWIIEVAELDTMSRAEVSTIKAFMSRTHDRFRPPYGKRLVDLPRQCVFAGSVNPEGGYLKDATGGRRFWPVVCGSIDLDALAKDRPQLWAEAGERFRRGEPWWLETAELDRLAAEQQAERYQADAWEEVIANWLVNEFQWADHGYERVKHVFPRSEPLNDVSVGEVLEHALGIERGRWTQNDQNRVVRCLVSMGFKLMWARRGERREKRYRRPGVPKHSVVAFPMRDNAPSAAE